MGLWTFYQIPRAASDPIQSEQSLMRESSSTKIGECSLNMTRECEDIEGGLRKFLDTRKGDSEKIVGLGGEAPKICILQNYQERGRGAPKKLNR